MDATKIPRTNAFFEELGLDNNQRSALSALPRGIQEKLDTFFGQIRAMQFLNPDGNPKKEWKLFSEEKWSAARDAAWDAASSLREAVEAVDAALDAAGKAASGAVAGTERDATGNVVLEIIWHKILKETVTRHTTLVGEDDVAVDAALYARYLVVSDLDFPDKEKHWKHAQERWEVWQKGYALFCDINGELYVYCKSDELSGSSTLRR